MSESNISRLMAWINTHMMIIQDRLITNKINDSYTILEFQDIALQQKAVIRTLENKEAADIPDPIREAARAFIGRVRRFITVQMESSAIPRDVYEDEQPET